MDNLPIQWVAGKHSGQEGFIQLRLHANSRYVGAIGLHRGKYIVDLHDHLEPGLPAETAIFDNLDEAKAYATAVVRLTL